MSFRNGLALRHYHFDGRTVIWQEYWPRIAPIFYDAGRLQAIVEVAAA